MWDKNYSNDSSGTLLDEIVDKFSLKNDAALAKFLDLNPPVISKMRHGTLPFGATMIITVHERTDWSIASIKKMIASKK